jgi:hypothetical protein
MKSRVAVAAALALLLAGAAFFYLPDLYVDDSRVEKVSRLASAIDSVADASGAGLSEEERMAALAASLREKYLDRIDNSVWQVKLIDHLINLMKQLDPDNWQARVEAILRAAFPNWIDQLLDRMAAMLSYEEWLANKLPLMTFESSEARYAALWEMRRALFGEDAELIWAGELQERQFRQQLGALDSNAMPWSEKTAQYVALLAETYGDRVFGNQGVNTSQLMGEFLQLDSVQDALRSADAEQQAELLRAFRKKMGLDEAALARWQELDAARRQQRVSGDSYMAERQALSARLSGEALEQAVQQLQVRYFGEEEARFIRNEEASGVFRFEDRQIIGIN